MLLKMGFNTVILTLKTDKAFFDAFGSLVTFVYFQSTEKNKPLRGPSSEHSYQIWFQYAQWFQRRSKTDKGAIVVTIVW